MKKLVIPEEYEVNGEKKTRWNQIGVLFEGKGKEYVKLNHIPNTLIHVFEIERREEKPSTGYQQNNINYENPPF